MSSFLRKRENRGKREIWRKLREFTKYSVETLLQSYPFEKIHPYNLWFRDGSLVSGDFLQNGQHLRLRYFCEKIINPFVPLHMPFNPASSLYQPFYPENFYTFWEFLSTGFLYEGCLHTLFLGEDYHLGMLEALLVYFEKTNWSYTTCNYHIWTTENPRVDMKTATYTEEKSVIPYLGQAYQVAYLKNSNDLRKYRLIILAVQSLFSSLSQWEEEEDFQKTIFYLSFLEKYLEEGGNLIIYLNLCCGEKWDYILSHVCEKFKEYSLYRPHMTHVLNPEVYLFLKGFQKSESCPFEKYDNFYLWQTYKILQICPPIIKSPISKKFRKLQEKWTSELYLFSPHRYTTAAEGIVDDWFQKNALAQIKNIKPQAAYNFLSLHFKKITPVMEMKLSIWSSPFVQQKSRLAHCKRMIDTRPHNAFSHRRNSHYFLSWDDLTNLLTIFNPLKKILIKNRIEIPTNAWMKMYEILNHDDLLPLTQTEIKTFHLCEAPGAFVSAFNHYLQFHYKGKWTWYAQTLKPTVNGEMTDAALCDYYNLIVSYPQNWIFGDETDCSGDITHLSVIKSYRENPLLRGIDFMTADGGLECHPHQLNDQEKNLARVNLGQVLCILSLLPVGKSALIKMFLPLAEPLTISLIYLLHAHFHKLLFIKPIMSHSYNSEIYILVKDYQGIDKITLEKLSILLDDPKTDSHTCFYAKFPKKFLQNYQKSIDSLIGRQIDSLHSNYYYYYHLSEIPDPAIHLQKWLEKNPIKPPQKKLFHF